MNAKRSAGGRTHRFGGDWTTAKLDVIARYLASYTTALKDQPSKEHPFVKGYIDAFAGTGYRDARRDDRSDDASQALLLPDLAEPEPQALLDGSARRSEDRASFRPLRVHRAQPRALRST